MQCILTCNRHVSTLTIHWRGCFFTTMAQWYSNEVNLLCYFVSEKRSTQELKGGGGAWVVTFCFGNGTQKRGLCLVEFTFRRFQCCLGSCRVQSTRNIVYTYPQTPIFNELFCLRRSVSELQIDFQAPFKI